MALLPEQWMTHEEMRKCLHDHGAETDWKKYFEETFCGGKVFMNGHFLPCDANAEHKSPCGISHDAWRFHIRQPEAVCRKFGCPAIVND